MFDIGWTELVLIGVVALIVIGPKDLPVMFQTLGRFTGRLRGMAREFQTAMDQAAKESGVKDAAKDLKSLASPKTLGIDSMRDAADRFEKWDPMKPKLPTLPQPGTAAAPAPTKTPTAVATPAPAAKPEGPATAALRETVAARREAAARPPATEAAPDTGTDFAQKAPQE
jgi:sec-independent protein translocase protein TatB